MKLKPINLDQLAKIRDGSGHSCYGPSGSAMYLNCVGSLIPNLLANDVAGIDAAWGTVAHGVTELWGKTGKRPDHLVGTNEWVEAGDWGYLIDIDDVMLDFCQMCIDWVDFLPGEKFWERRVDFSRLTPIPRQSGTADFIAIDRKKKRMVVTDWKFGKAHQIFAEGNTQGMLYALGALFEFDAAFDGFYDIQEIEIRIAQPRLDHFDVWIISRDDLLEWSAWAKERMALAWTINAPRTAGAKQCEFCRVKATCAANAKLNIEMTEGIFTDTTEPVDADDMLAFQDRVDDLNFEVNPTDVGTLSTSQLASMSVFRSMAERWWKSLDVELLRRAKVGEDMSKHGLKIVESRSFRVFNDDKVAVRHIVALGVPRSDVVTEKVATPAQAEKLLRKAGHKHKDIPSLLVDLISKPPGKPTLAPLSDKRAAIVDLSEAVFGDTTNPEDETQESEY